MQPRPTPRQQQRGAALMIMLVILIMGVATILITSLSSTALKQTQQKTTEAVLAQAKEALIGYAISYGDTHTGEGYGYLPCPDVNGGNGEGSSPGSSCGTTEANSIGRLPWRTLDLPTLRASNGDCLWYAVSGSYKNNPKSATAMNWDNTGKLHVFSAEGNEIAANEIVALVIAPGTVTSSAQDRSGNTAPICGGNYTASAYLDNDTLHAINNAAIATGSFILPHQHRDANGNITVQSNDQITYITRQDIWTAIQRRIAKEAKTCLDDYAASSGGKYPWAVPVSTSTLFTPFITGEYNTRFGRLPTRPSIQTEATPADITQMQQKFSELWLALETFKANKTSANHSAMRNKADAAKNAADNVKNNYDNTPLENPADALKDAAGNAKDNLNISSSNTQINAIQQTILNAANNFVAALASEFSQASGMANTWPGSCTLFSSTRWESWRNLLFYQVADGYKPGSGASCGNCLSVEGGGHNAAGSGSYRAAVIVAGKQLTANRTPANLGDYLEADNQLPRNDSTKPYKTYHVTDSDYRINNDLVLCLDGRVNCL